ncbi:M24 family metallopeptidase, partial [Halocynthiibacter sp.]|uniref:M24 family metallopeptidase n=1 Tax=Halocynthiibacter sp. TaxID=1979210 RepID=UPI003C67A4C6
PFFISFIANIARKRPELKRDKTILSEIVHDVVSEITPGMTTRQIDEAIRLRIVSNGLIPTMLGYRGFPAVSAISVSPALLHSPPSGQTVSNGDLLTIQTSASSNFSHASLGFTFPVGCISREGHNVVSGCRRALENAIKRVRAGVRTGEVSHEIQQSLEAFGLAPIRDFVGYSMGRERIQAPQILGYGPPTRGDVLEAGMILNIHVIGSSGDFRTRVDPDLWTVRMRDEALAAIATAMVLVQEDGYKVLTRLPEVSSVIDDCSS